MSIKLIFSKIFDSKILYIFLLAISSVAIILATYFSNKNFDRENDRLIRAIGIVSRGTEASQRLTVAGFSHTDKDIQTANEASTRYFDFEQQFLEELKIPIPSQWYENPNIYLLIAFISTLLSGFRDGLRELIK